MYTNSAAHSSASIKSWQVINY